MTPTARRKTGLVCIVAPPVMIFGSLILWPIVGFVISVLIVSDGYHPVVSMIARLANILLGLTGVLGLLGVLTALPIGLYLFFSTPKSPATPPNVPPQAP